MVVARYSRSGSFKVIETGIGRQGHIAEIYRPGLAFSTDNIFIQLYIASSRKKRYLVNRCITVIQRHWLVSNRKCIHMRFSVVPIFCHFRDITIYWSKISNVLYPTRIRLSDRRLDGRTSGRRDGFCPRCARVLGWARKKYMPCPYAVA